MGHAKTPWSLVGSMWGTRAVDANGVTVVVPHADMSAAETEATMQRIVACVNSCEGMDTEALEVAAISRPNVCEWFAAWCEADELRRQRDELLAILQQAQAALPDAWLAVKCDVPRELIDRIAEVIAKTK